jgi:hypothetical protein
LPFQRSISCIGTGGGRAEARPYHNMSTLERGLTGNIASGRVEWNFLFHKNFCAKDKKSTMLPQAILPFTG